MPERGKKSKKKHARPGPLRVAIVGAGRLGTVLGRGLARAGYRIELVVSRRMAQARQAAQRINSGASYFALGQAARPATEHLERLDSCDLVLIATPDEVIGAVATQLSALLQHGLDAASTRRRAPRTALHTSGALSSALLQPLVSADFATGSLHPLVAVSDPTVEPDLFRRAFFCVEGDRAALRVARAIARNLGANSFTINAGAKALYHASAVTASGQMVALFDIALEMLDRCGLPRRRARQVLLPLLESTVANLATKDPVGALTGTFARGDVSTVRKHWEAMKAQHLRDAMTAYVLLGRRSLSLANRTNPRSKELEQVATLLANFVKEETRR